MNAQPNTVTDLDAYWMPFTANRQFKAAPRLLVGASGMYYTTHDGQRVLDGTAGLWCVNAGHCRSEIADAVLQELRLHALERERARGFGRRHAREVSAEKRRIGVRRRHLNALGASPFAHGVE